MFSDYLAVIEAGWHTVPSVLLIHVVMHLIVSFRRDLMVVAQCCVQIDYYRRERAGRTTDHGIGTDYSCFAAAT